MVISSGLLKIVHHILSGMKWIEQWPQEPNSRSLVRGFYYGTVNFLGKRAIVFGYPLAFWVYEVESAFNKLS